MRNSKIKCGMTRKKQVKQNDAQKHVKGGDFSKQVTQKASAQKKQLRADAKQVQEAGIKGERYYQGHTKGICGAPKTLQ
jgi:hypothetical protein